MNPGDHRGWIVDASVAVKWFLGEAVEPGSTLAREAIGPLSMRTTTLAFYEVGSVLGRVPGARGESVGAALEMLREICGPPVDLEPRDFTAAADLAARHGITFYDASYRAIAERLNRGVISADRDLLEPGLAVTPAQALSG
jgi:predicted nucleic acid-binding protein